MFKNTLRAALHVLCITIAGCACAQAPLIDIGPDLPSVEQVKSAIQGKDELEIAARRAGAFRALWAIDRDIFQPARGYRQAENEHKMMGLYGEAGGAIDSVMRAKLGPPGLLPNGAPSNYQLWFQEVLRLGSDQTFQDEVAQKLFTPGLYARYRTLKTERDKRFEQIRHEDDQRNERQNSIADMLLSLPTPEKVLKSIEGVDEMDVLAKKWETLVHITHFIDAQNEGGGAQKFSDAFWKVKGLYNTAMSKMNLPHANGRNADGSLQPWTEEQVRTYDQAETKYSRMPQLLNETFRPLLDNAAEEALDKWLGGGSDGETVNTQVIPAFFRGAVWNGIGLFVLVIVLLGIIRELRPAGMDPKQPNYYRVGFKKYRLDGVVGTIPDRPHHSSESTYHSGWDQNDRRYSYTKTTTRQQFFIKTDDGREIPVNLVDRTVDVRPGHRVALINVSTGSRGGHLVFHNYNTGQYGMNYYQPDYLAMVRYKRTVLIAVFIAARFLSDSIVGASMPALDPDNVSLGTIKKLLVLGAVSWVVPILALVAYIIFGRLMVGKRKRQFNDVIMPKLTAYLATHGRLEGQQ